MVQLTPVRSSCSVAFGKGLTSGQPGSVQRLILAVRDLNTARADLISRGPGRRAANERPSEQSGLWNIRKIKYELMSAAEGVDYACRDTGGGEGAVPLVLLQRFRGNLDNWDQP